MWADSSRELVKAQHLLCTTTTLARLFSHLWSFFCSCWSQILHSERVASTLSVSPCPLQCQATRADRFSNFSCCLSTSGRYCFFLWVSRPTSLAVRSQLSRMCFVSRTVFLNVTLKILQPRSYPIELSGTACCREVWAYRQLDNVAYSFVYPYSPFRLDA